MIFTVAVAFFILGACAMMLASLYATKSWSNIGDILGPIRASVYRTPILEGFFTRGRIPMMSTQKNEAPNSKLLTKEQIESQFETSSWQSLAYDDFKTAILAKATGANTFPCIYATMGYRTDDHRYIFLESDNPAEPRNIRLIAPALHQYLLLSPSLGPNTSLVIIGAPSDTQKTVEEYNDTFWQTLRGLRIADPAPWPENVPENVESEKWTFCYNGEAVFPVMLTPAHSKRWSRHMSVPVIALQPKWVLDKLLNTTEGRVSATKKVRKLLKKYDQVPISPDLTSYGQSGSSESRQLCLLDENKTAECPFRNLDI